MRDCYGYYVIKVFHTTMGVLLNKICGNGLHKHFELVSMPIQFNKFCVFILILDYQYKTISQYKVQK